MGGAGNKGRCLSAGFAFTISAIIISATLLSIAIFASQQHSAHQAALDTPALNDAASAIAGRTASELSSLLHASAGITGKGGTRTLKVAASFPLAREGAPVADLWEYSRALSDNYRASAYEVLLVPGGWATDNQTAILLPGGGFVSCSNALPNDMVLLRHPPWSLNEMAIWVNCEGRIVDYVPLYQKSGEGKPTVNYRAYYTDPSGTREDNFRGKIGEVEFSLAFEDGSNLTFSNIMQSDTNSLTALSYTKSPAAVLVLPFDENSSSGIVRDYSPFGRNGTLGDVGGRYRPIWRKDCARGGCYEFNGSSFISFEGLNFTQKPVVFGGESGTELLANGNFENFVGQPDDGGVGGDDNWDGWQVNNPATYPQAYFDASTDAYSGTYAVHIYNEGRGGEATLQQQRDSVEGGVNYSFSFYTKGKGNVYYRIMIQETGEYLQEDGSWSPSEYTFSAAVEGSYSQKNKIFTMPSGMPSYSIIISFVAPRDVQSDYFVDLASLKKSGSGDPNFGFEQYSETPCSFAGWEKQNGKDEFYCSEESEARSGQMALKASFSGEESKLVNGMAELESGREYSFSFWARTVNGSGSGIRYALYDEQNGLYLQDDGGWGSEENIFWSQATDSEYHQVVRNFRTYGSGVGKVDIIFLPPTEDIALVDDVSLVEVFDFSVEAWLKPDYSGSAMGIISQREEAREGYYGLNFHSAGAQVYANAESGEKSIKASFPAAGNGWKHLLLSVNRTGNYSYYLDGDGTKSGRAEIGLVNSTTNLLIGGNVSKAGLQDGEFEIPQTAFSPDDGIDDAWRYWAVSNNDPQNAYFDSTLNSKSGTYAVKIWRRGGGVPTESSIYQNGVVLYGGDRRYLLSFWARAETVAGAYSIYDTIRREYLQEDGSWAGSYHKFAFGGDGTGGGWFFVSKIFSAGLDDGERNARLSFLLPENPGEYYVDSVSLLSISNPFSGLIDEVRVYNRTFSPQEARQHYRGIYQKPCKVEIETGYAFSSSAQADLNATIYISKRLPGLVSYLPFDDNPADGRAYDYAGFSRWARVVAPAESTAGVRGNALLLDGRGGYASTSVYSTPSITVAMWAKSSEENWNRDGWLASAPGSNGFEISPHAGGKAVEFYLYDQEGNPHNLGQVMADDIGRWHHYAFTYDAQSGTYAVYLDGVEEGTGTLSLASAPRTAASVDVCFGSNCYHQTAPTYGKGAIDEVRVYSRALSAEEIKRLYEGSYVLFAGRVVASRG